MTFEKKDCPINVEPKHFEEWVIKSAISPKITALSVNSLSIPEEIDKLLNRNTKNRWGGSWQHGSGWAVTGVDPETGHKTWDGAQFKPDKEVQNQVDGIPKFKRDGSPDIKKYFSASGCETSPLFLDTGEPDYWLKVKNDITIRILIGEGAKKAGSSLTAGEAFISIPGVSNGQRKGRLKKSLERFCDFGREIVIAFDSDQHYNPNVCRELNKLACLLRNHGVLVKVLMLPRNTKGVDDFIVLYGAEAFKQLVDQALTFEEWRDEYFTRSPKQVKTPTPDLPEVEENHQLKAQAALFSDRPWVSIDGSLYQWVGTHYAIQSEAAIKRRISEWCRSTPVWVGGEWKYSYATASAVDGIYAWVQRAFAIDPATVNPPGINCLNGTLKIAWHGLIPSWELVKHDPAIPYTYAGDFEYNPNADPTACDRLLACLDAPQRAIFLKTLAATLDLNTIRKLRGRSIRALLCKGDGNNGKDSLREAVSLLYGVGVVSVTVMDGVLYDQGKKFPFAKLEHARISWSSENSSFSSLDAIQGFKAAITGETIYIEHKCVDERPINPATVFFFNINNLPSLQASLEAIQSRWAILSFNKTFKTNADPAKGELEADPRFRYDPNFLKTEVVPSLLNKMLEVLPEVAMYAIDYSCTEPDLKEIQEQTNHLWQFVREFGLHYQPDGRVYINELWQKLEQWYLDNGTLIITTDEKGKQKRDWHDQVQRGDKNVKGSNQIEARFSQLFPKIKKERDYSHGEQHGLFYLSGISFGSPVGSAVDHQLDHQLDQQLSAYTQMDHHGSPVEPPLEQVINLIKKLSVQEKHRVVKLLIHDDPFEYTRTTADPTGDPTGDPLLIQTSQQKSLIITPNAYTKGNTDCENLKAVNKIKNVKQDNSTKNFHNDSNIPEFKVGDKCKAKYSDIYQVSSNKELTIIKIDGTTATVIFPGCRSLNGVDVQLAELCKSDE